LWLGARIAGEFVAALSQHNVLHALGEHGASVAVALPLGAVGARVVSDVPALHRLLRRAFQLSKALPDELLHTFQTRIIALPTATEAERLVIQRIGQDLFRDGLLDLWEGRCAVTGLAVPELLRASHIKPWADCETDTERLDVYNGILLAPHLDAAFDRGLVTFDDAGVLIVSGALDDVARTVLGLDTPLRMRQIEVEHRRYLPWHRERVFKASNARFGCSD
jgi:predicted restriction endonuclease